MNFRIKKRLQFGEALYICGDIEQLGSWDVFKAYRLTWNQVKFLLFFRKIYGLVLQHSIQIYLPSLSTNISSVFGVNHQYLQFYGKTVTIIAQYIQNQNIITKSQVKPVIIQDDKWNMQKISLNLMILQNQDVYNNYSIIGNHIQLGNWKTRIPLNKRSKNYTISNSQIDTDQDSLDDYNIYSYTFEIYRGREKFRYYYIREANYFCQPERHPGRLFILGKENSHHPDYFKTIYNNGKIQLYEKCNFQFLNFSQITQNLFLGAYPKSVDDIKILKKSGVNAILSIQTEQDFNRHNISFEHFKSVCVQENIQCSVCSIKDMDKADFLSKAEGALQVLRRWNSLNYTIYVHCSAGIYRSPQIMILHLISSLDYNIEKAIQLVKSRHPYANPNLELVLTISQKINSQKNSEQQNQNQRDQKYDQISFKQKLCMDFKDQPSQEIQLFEYH